MKVYKVSYNDFGEAFVFAESFKRAEFLFQTWFFKKLKDGKPEDLEIKSIIVEAGEPVI